MKKIIIIVISVIFVAILIENVINKISDVTEGVVTKVENKKEQEKYENKPVDVREEKANSIIQDVFVKIQNSDYEALYNLLSKEYKDYMRFESVDDFKTHLEAYWGTPKKIRLVEYSEYNGEYECTVGVTTDTVELTRKMLINVLDSENYNLIIDNINSIKEISNLGVSDADFDYKVKYIVKRGNQLIYAMDLGQRKFNSVKCDIENVILKKANNTQYTAINLEELKGISASGGTIVRVYFVFDVGETNSYGDLQLNWSISKNNGTKNDLQIDVDAERGY